jgi:hypothetical protein
MFLPLTQITLQMQDDIDSQNRTLDGMNNSIGTISSDIQRTFLKFRIVMQQPYYRKVAYITICVLILFVIFLCASK